LGSPRLKRLAAVILGFICVTLAGYTAYVGAIGSELLVDPAPRKLCSTPDVRFGWSYEAINYDIADDAALIAANPDLDDCAGQGTGAGGEVVTDDGVPIAGWYIPSAEGHGPTGPTVILVHGWNGNKSDVLRYAAPLHDRFNIVALDLRHGGRSGERAVTFGVQERLDIEAVVDWLARTKAPRAIGLMGSSMGGAAAAAAAVGDPRIVALLLDSTHASAVQVIGRRLSVEAGHPPYPGAWGIVAGAWLRTGLDIRGVDPVETVPRLGDRPVLLIHGSHDPIDVPAESAERIVEAARAAGVDIRLQYCDGGGHGNLIDHCPEGWGAWAVAFFERAFDQPGQPITP